MLSSISNARLAVSLMTMADKRASIAAAVAVLAPINSRIVSQTMEWPLMLVLTRFMKMTKEAISCNLLQSRICGMLLRVRAWVRHYMSISKHLPMECKYVRQTITSNNSP